MIKRRMVTYKGDEDWVIRTICHSLAEGENPIGIKNKITIKTIESKDLMTAEEAREKLRSMFKGSVCAEKTCWYHESNDLTKEECAVLYDFGRTEYVKRVVGNTFEECFEKIENAKRSITEAVNAEIKKYSILLRKFD